MVTPTMIVAYLALFAIFGFLFIFASLFAGRFLRPYAPNKEKLEVYECGEPTIGSSFVQFDLRFYVVALLFIIFDVEVAFFFPWAVVYGKTCQLMDPNLPLVVQSAKSDLPVLTPDAKGIYRELGISNPDKMALPAVDSAAKSALITSVDQAKSDARSTAVTLARLSLADIGVFFAVLLVGFAYVWRRGDLDWVRAVSQDKIAAKRNPAHFEEREPVLSA